MKKYFWVSIILVVIGAVAIGVFSRRTQPIVTQEKSQSVAPATDQVEITSSGKDSNQVESKAESAPPTDRDQKIPEKMFVKVPFTSQAPFSQWDERHEEACEEASLLMVAYYLQKKSLNRDIAEKEIQAMINFQIKNYGDYKDSNAAGVVRLAKDYFNLDNLRAIYDFKPEDLRREVARGNPVIVLAAGRRLGNPNFTAPGPLYHALVVVGYDGQTIITNDPGTRKGEGYRYDLDTLYSAIHDFPGRLDDIEKGRKAMIVIAGDN
ncbi:hypothetical protein EPO05_02620 [Patescibacteria group bacterium]|nr:MAG: hypothetical protein EPO05_02620 [Patescibacteria group bacterium]